MKASFQGDFKIRIIRHVNIDFAFVVVESFQTSFSFKLS